MSRDICLTDQIEYFLGYMYSGDIKCVCDIIAIPQRRSPRFRLARIYHGRHPLYHFTTKTARCLSATRRALGFLRWFPSARRRSLYRREYWRISLVGRKRFGRLLCPYFFVGTLSDLHGVRHGKFTSLRLLSRYIFLCGLQNCIIYQHTDNN